MFRKLRRTEEHHRTAESSQRRSIKIISAYIINNYGNSRVSNSTVIRHRQEIIRYCFSNESLILIFPNSVIQDQVSFPDLLCTTKRFLWLLWPLPDIFSSSWREFSPSLIALNLLSSAFHRRIKGVGKSCGKDESFFNRIEIISVYFCQFFENWGSMRIWNEIELYKSGEKWRGFLANNLYFLKYGLAGVSHSGDCFRRDAYLFGIISRKNP